MDMYYEHEAYNLVPMFIPASRAYYGYFNIKSGKEDEVGARKVLLEERENIAKSGDREAFNLHIQNYPLEVQEAFLNTKTARFDNSRLNKAGI